MKKSFEIVSGEGLGLINTTHAILEKLPIQSTPFGQAKINTYANIANGNLIVQTPVLHSDELGHPFLFYWTYNSQASQGQNWRFNWQKQLTFLNHHGFALKLIEGDGHVTTYYQIPQKNNYYFADLVGEGTPFIYFDDSQNLWRWYDPKHHITEYYDANGRLVSYQTLQGQTTTFNYDSQGRLAAINAASGVVYTLSWSNNGMVLSCIENDLTTVLRTYGFDQQGRLFQETFWNSGYTITYGYLSITPWLMNITQTDQTLINFDFDRTSWKVTKLQYGVTDLNTIDYSNFPLVTLWDVSKDATQFTLDNNNFIAQIGMQIGYSGVDQQDMFEFTQYVYQNGVLTKLRQPDGSVINYTYDPIFNLKTLQLGPELQKRAWFYQQGGDVPLLICQADYLDPVDPRTALVTRSVYDQNFDGKNNSFLRFQLSPAGRVIEYRPDATASVGSERTYVINKFDVSTYPPDTTPALSTMQTWIIQQEASQVNLTTYTRNQRGQVLFKNIFTAVDEKGEGIFNDTTGEFRYGWNLYGDCIETVERMDKENIEAYTNHSFDDLRRETLRIDALDKQWQWNYEDNQQQVKTTQPSGRQDIQPWDWHGLMVSDLATVLQGTTLENRLTRYRRDLSGLPIITITPTLATQEADLPRLHQFYNRQYELGFEVSYTGQVTEYRRDKLHRIYSKIKYANAIDVTQLYLTWPPQPSDLPYVALLIQQLPTQLGEEDQLTLQCFTPSGKLRYNVDEENYLTEHRYDNLDHEIVKIIYREKLTIPELQQLQKGLLLNRVPNPSNDHITRTFYGVDNEIIATQDEVGYVTENIYDAGKRIAKTILYDTKAIINLPENNFDHVRPQSSLKDANTYFWYDLRNEEIVNVNSENVLTLKAYFPTGKIRQSITYATQVTIINNLIPITPPTLAEDQLTYWSYDLLKRIVQIDQPFGKTQHIHYDINGNTIFDQTVDRYNPSDIAPNFQRNQQYLFDAWNQKRNEANVFIGQILVEIDADPNLTEQEKIAEKEKIWEQFATQYIYDPTGLLLTSRNPLGGISFHYSDFERRLCYTVDPTGAISQNIYDSFNRVIGLYLFDNRIPYEILQTLQGGFITSDLKNYFDGLRHSTSDRVTLNKYDRRDLKTGVMDSEFYFYGFQYNAFRKCEVEQLAVENSLPSLTITHTFDPRGLEIKTQKQSGDLITVTASEYENPLGKETTFVNELGGRTQKFYNRLGQQIRQINALNIIEFVRKLDAFNRVFTEANAEGVLTQHIYNQEERSHTIVYPIDGVIKQEIQDVFGQIVDIIDAQGSINSYEHAPHGAIHKQIDPLFTITQTNFNLIGLPSSIIHPNNAVDNKIYNSAGQLMQECQDVEGQQLITNYQPNAFSENAKIIDPRAVMTENFFDKRGLKTQTLIDPSIDNKTGLNLQITRTFNGQKSQISEDQGDAQNPNQYQEIYQRDGLNRDVGKTIDPNGLNLKTIKTLNEAGLVKAEQDANGNITRTFYNPLKQKRFTVDSEGGVIEWVYDNVGRVHCERHLTNAVDTQQLNDNTTLAQFENLIVRDNSDGQRWTFYDPAGRENFTVNSQGQVTQKILNTTDDPIQTIIYAATIDPASLPTITTNDLLQWVQTHQNPKQDHMTYRIFDVRHQERYKIDPRGYIKEKRYNANKQRIAKISYATQLTDPAKIASLPLDQVNAAIPKDSVNDRETWHIFNNSGRPWFTVKKISATQAAVTRFDHDRNGNQTQICTFDQAITWPQNYDALLATCISLVPDSTIDHIVKTDFDNANRKTIETDAMGYSKQFLLDAIGNQKTLIDEINNAFNYGYDSAKRKTQEFLPPCDITFVTQTGTDPHWALTAQTQNKLSVQHQFDVDNVGNVIQIARALGTSEQRVVQFTYDGRNLRISTTINGIAIDDPSKNASWAQRPEVSVNLSKNTYYDARQRKVAETDFSGEWTFYLYDSENREIFQILPNKGVIGKTYNGFGEKISETRYENALTIDLTPYMTTGIVPLGVVQNNLVPSSDDRTTTYSYNLGGLIENLAKPSKPYFLSDDQDGQYGITSPQKVFDYNAFNQEIFSAELVDPQQNIWKRQLTWYDPSGKKIATCGFNNQIIRRYRNTFGRVIQRNEWGSVPSIIPTELTTLAQLDASYQPNPKDRFYSFTFNLNNKKISRTLKNQVIQQLVLDPNTNVPSLINLPPQDLIQYYSYDPRNLKSVFQHENGAVEFFYYNAIKKLIAQTGVTRTSLNGNSMTPLIYYGVNCHGEQALKTNFASGTKNPIPNQLPAPISPNPAVDQTEWEQMDNRGLKIAKQTAEGTTTFFTYTAVRKEAREYKPLSETTPSGMLLHLDERRDTYNVMNKPTITTYVRDAQYVRIDNAQYNTFNEVIAEGETNISTGVTTYFQFHFRTSDGFAWKHNTKKGAWVINLRNLQNSITLDGQSPTDDLSQIAISDLPNLLDPTQWPYNRLERTEKEYNPDGKVIVQRAPAYEQTVGPDNILLNVYVGTAYASEFGAVSLNWLVPKETNVTPTFVIAPLANPTDTQTLPIQMQNGRCGVDVSQLSTDIYNYTISYALTIGNKPVVYQSIGQVQFESLSSTNSLTVVPIVEDDNQVRLVGNTTGLTAVDVWQGTNDLIAQVPVTYNLTKQAFYADLSQLTSGSYTITPVSPHIPNPIQSLPMTIFTATPSPTPLSREIDATVNLKWLDSHVEFDWKVPSAFSDRPIKLGCVYVSTDGEAYIQEATIIPGEIIGIYYDESHRPLYCNCEFAKPIVAIARVDVLLGLDNTDSNTFLPILINAIPELQKNELRNSSEIQDIIQIIRQKHKPTLKPIKLSLHEQLLESQKKLISHLPKCFSVDVDNMIQYANFAPRNIVWLMSIANPTQYQTLLFKDMRDDRQAQWKQMLITGIISPQTGSIIPPGIVFDVTGLSFGNYPWMLSQSDQLHKILFKPEQALQGVFTVEQKGVVFSSNDFTNNTQLIRPIHLYTWDNWKNQTSHTNSLGQVTTQEFNVFNEVEKTIEPQVVVMDEMGNTTLVNPVTTYGYDCQGKIIGATDANGHTEGYKRDEAEQTIQHVFADGTNNQKNELNTFGNDAVIYDDQNQAWQRLFNRRNQLVTQITPIGRRFNYGYDEADHRSSQTYPSGATYLYSFDNFSNIAKSFLPLTQETDFIYERNHQLVSQQNPGSALPTILLWTRDYWGNPLTHRDLGGANYNYTYNYRKMVVQEWSVGGSHGQGLLLQNVFDSGEGISFIIHAYPLPGKNLQYSYQVNDLIGVNDLASQQLTNYTLNSEGCRTGLVVTGPNQQLLRQVSSQFDNLNRETLIYDQQSTMQLFYDAVSNRRRMATQITFYDPSANQIVSTSRDSWFLYDAADRFTIFDGVLGNNGPTIIADHGSALTYQGNLRASMEYYQTVSTSVNGGTTAIAQNIQTLNWANNDSRLNNAITQSQIPGKNWQIMDQEIYQWDQDDQVTVLQTYSTYWNGLYNNPRVDPNFDANGWQRSCQEVTSFSNGYNADTYVTETTYGLDSSTGILLNQQTNFTDEGNSDDNYQDNLTSNYVWFDNPQLSQLGGTRTNSNGTSPYTSSGVYYNANGQFSAALIGGDNPGLNYIVQTYEGLILLSTTIQNGNVINDFGAMGGWHSIIYQGSFDYTNTFYFHNTRGEILASYSPIIQNIATFQILPGYLLPVSSNFPPRTSQRYEVQGIENFQQLSTRFYSDPNFASALALRNGYANADVVPSSGTTLDIPLMLPSHNQYGTYSSYNQLIESLLANIYPTFHTPRPRPHHQSWWKSLVECLAGAIVAAVVFEFFPYFAFLSQMMISAIAGALGSLAQQGTAILLHDQKRIYWRSVFENAVEAVLFYGNAKLYGVNLSELKEVTVEECAKIALAAAQGDVETQLLEMASGMRKQFDMNQVVEYSFATVVSESTSLKVNAIRFSSERVLNKFLQSFAMNEVSDLSSSALDSLLRGRQFDLALVEAQAIGTSLGSALPEAMTEVVSGLKSDYLQASKASNGNPSVDTQQAKIQTNSVDVQLSQQNAQTSTSISSLQSASKLPSGVSDDYNASPSDTASNLQNQSYAKKLNQFGIFGGGQQTPNQVQYSDALTQAVEEKIGFETGTNNSVSQNLVSFSNTQNTNVVQSTPPTLLQSVGKEILQPMKAILPNSINSLFAPDLGLKSYAVNWIKGYVAEHGSIGVDFSFGIGVALDLDLALSKQGITIFAGLGAGLGFDLSFSGNYDFQNTSGFTSKTSVNTSLSAVPVQIGGSVMVSQKGPAYSLDIQTGEGLEIESVVGYTKTFDWDNSRNLTRRMMS